MRVIHAILLMALAITIVSCSSTQHNTKSSTPAFRTNQTAIKAPGLKEQVADIRQWVITKVIPDLAAYNKNIDPKYKGVSNSLASLNDIDFSKPIDVKALSDKRFDFWRGVLEMNVNDQLIACIPMFLYAANGQIGAAESYASFVNAFSSDSSFANTYIAEFAERLKVFRKEHNRRVQEGIVLHDKGEYQKAIAIYGEILKDYPHSSWARHEKFLSNMVVDSSYSKNWPEEHKKILEGDHLYNKVTVINTGKEAYKAIQRMTLDSLFEDSKKLDEDLVTMAEITMDLGNYGFSAQLFWFAITHFKYSDADHSSILAHFLYCLEQLGVTEIKSNFKGDYEQAFKQITETRHKMMTDSEVYNKFKNKG